MNILWKGKVGDPVANTIAIVGASLLSNPRIPTFIDLSPKATTTNPTIRKRVRTRDAVTEPTTPPMMAFDAMPDELRIGTKLKLSSGFKSAFWAVLAITVATLIGLLWTAAAWPHPTPAQQHVNDVMDFAFKAGFGGIIGLLGGKQA
jgi:hypothetical protein